MSTETLSSQTLSIVPSQSLGEDLYVEGMSLGAQAFLAIDFAWPCVELIEGKVRMVPPPSHNHQRTSMRLSLYLESHVIENNLGETLAAPNALILSDANVVQPDLMWFPKDHPRTLSHDNHDQTPPGLVVEILSPSNAQYDLTTKKELYREAGVPFYWIVDPMEKTISALELIDGNYQPTGATKDAHFSAKPFEGLSFAIADVFPW